MLGESLNHYRMFHFPGGGVLPETSEVIPAVPGWGRPPSTSAATGDATLVAQALKMGQAVADMVYDDGGLTTKGMVFATPESWLVDDVNLVRYTGYTRNRSIWQIVDALDTVELPARPEPSFERA